ncbi:MAG: adenylate/guanylate cyclase domain-containing protein [Thermodesulfobacteriota bacterium]
MHDLSQCTVMIVDDTETNVKLLVELLGDSYDLTVAMDGRTALEIVQEAVPDLILLDIMMPEMDGYEVCRRLKADPTSADIPIIFVTALGGMEDEAKGLELGAVDYITKPISPPILRARLRNHLELKWLRDQEKAYLAQLERDKASSENLLFNVLPRHVVGQLKDRGQVTAQSHEEATVLFADLVGFTELSSRLSPLELISMLNGVFSAFDDLAVKHGLEKIKTIGDAYMAVGGITHYHERHADSMADMALDMLDEIKRHRPANGQPLQLRVGMNTGPVMTGVIGTKKYFFDMWGDTVNVASRMESQGLPGFIQVTGATYKRLQEAYEFISRGVIHVKGKGEFATYFLLGRKGDARCEEARRAIQAKGLASHGLALAKEELKTLALSDNLTGLYSRNGFLSLAQQQRIIAQREKRNLLLLLVRLDNLEAVQDEHGPPKGDTALKEIARLLFKTFRNSDVVGRIGENLFLVLGMEITKAGDDVLETRLRQTLEKTSQTRLQPYPLQLSVARAAWTPESSLTLEDLLTEMESRMVRLSA